MMVQIFNRLAKKAYKNLIYLLLYIRLLRGHRVNIDFYMSADYRQIDFIFFTGQRFIKINDDFKRWFDCNIKGPCVIRPKYGFVSFLVFYETDKILLKECANSSSTSIKIELWSDFELWAESCELIYRKICHYDELGFVTIKLYDNASRVAVRFSGFEFDY